MARLSVDDLGVSAKCYRPDLVNSGADRKNRFETKEEAYREDARRSKLIEKAAADPQSLFDPSEALDLAQRLAYSGKPPQTLASFGRMRKKRIYLGSHQWKLAEDPTHGRVAVATLYPRGKEIKPEELLHFDPQAYLWQFRSVLNRYGAAESDGYLIAAVHLEFEPNKCLFLPHGHVQAAGGMIDVVNALRASDTYKSDRQAFHAGLDDCFQRIQISQGPLSNLPSPLTYLYQPFIPSRWVGKGADGQRVRQRDKCRVPEPYHTLGLLWLDRHRLRDLTLLLHLEVRATGFHVRPPMSRTPMEVRNAL